MNSKLNNVFWEATKWANWLLTWSKGKQKILFLFILASNKPKEDTPPPDAGLESQKGTVKFEIFGIRVLIQFCTTCRVLNFCSSKITPP